MTDDGQTEEIKGGLGNDKMSEDKDWPSKEDEDGGTRDSPSLYSTRRRDVTASTMANSSKEGEVLS